MTEQVPESSNLIELRPQDTFCWVRHKVTFSTIVDSTVTIYFDNGKAIRVKYDTITDAVRTLEKAFPIGNIPESVSVKPSSTNIASGNITVGYGST